jgi:aminopeptidase N
VLFTTKLEHLCLALTAATLAIATPALAEPKFSFANTPGQLPKTVVPESYAITLTPDPKTLQFLGSETINIDVRKPTRMIVLNALNLEIPEAKLTDLGLAATIKIDQEKQTATFTFAQVIATGKHKLTLSFKGKAGSQAEGLYYVNYQTDKGKKLLFGTQMEPTDARRMFETYLGEDKFRAGIRSYMATHKYGSTTTADLWEALQQTSGVDVGAVAAGWTEQPGLPVVTVDGTCTAGKRSVKLSQERFSIDDPKVDPLQWQIPITYTTTVEGTPQTYLLKDKSASLDAGSCDTPVKLNAGNTGYYRVQYSAALQQQLKDQFSLFPLTDRLNLLSDSWALVKAGRSSTRDYLNLAEGVREQTDLALWNQVLGTLSSIDDLQVGQPGRSAFQSYGRDFLGNLYKTLGWEAKPGESETTALLRSSMLTLLGDFRDTSVIAEARLRFATYLKDPKSLAPNLRPTVFHIVGRYSDQATYDQLHQLALKTQRTEEKRLFYGAMTDALDPTLAKQTLGIVFKNELAPGLASSLVLQVADNGEQPALAWDFAKTHVKELFAMQAFFARNRYIPRLAGNFSEQSRADELEAFAKANLSADAMSEVKKSVTRIRYRADLKKRELPIVDTYACNQKAGGSASNVRFCLDVR